ncbi:MAG TPA: PEP-CTERM sorting domain-containing protein [Tepidisphaeraceae bacterium]|nr:PEP-CTERM sorting domain-containing protein [Tepidisphaeraceae bacterium]
MHGLFHTGTARDDSTFTRLKYLALALAAIGIGAPAANATLIDVQWNPSTTANIMTGNAATGSTDTGSGSTAATTDIWNQATQQSYASTAPLALNDVAGNSTGVTLAVTGTSGIGNYGGTVNSAPASYFTTNVFPLFDNIIYSTSTTPMVTLTFNGLAAGNYNLFLYSSGDQNSNTRAIGVTANGGGATAGPINIGPSGGATAMTSGLNFGELSQVAVNSSGVLNVNVSSVSGELDVDGLQLQSVPEPGALGLLALGGMGLLSRRRRHA